MKFPCAIVWSSFALILECMGASQFSLSASGNPTSLVLDDVNRLASSSTDGFFLRKFDGVNFTDAAMGSVITNGNTIVVSESGGLPSFTFRINTYQRHFSIHLIDVQGIGTDRRYGLRLKLATNATIGIKTLDDVVERVSNPWQTSPTIYWKNLWGAEVDGTRGGVAIYDASQNSTVLDQSLAEIWTTEPIPRPAGQSSWTEADVLTWVANYQAKLGNMNEVLLEAATPAELYDLTDNLVFPNNIKRVYLHTKTWRGEYWPNYNSRVHVNTNVFPAGKVDLLAYANYLKAQGVLLRLHSVSCGIGRNEAPYIGATVDRRLASWGSGTLVDPINATTTSIRFRPAPGTTVPLLGLGIGHQHQELHYQFFRIGEEIVSAGKLTRTDEDVWYLENCTRGYQGTDSSSHVSGSDMAGLYCSYKQNYIPAYDLDQPNSLMDELAREYANFHNELQLSHLHFDGPEIHEIHPWVTRELFDRIYSYIDHPVTSSRVGRSIAANFEQTFSSTRNDRSYDYFAVEVGIRLDGTGSLAATGMLETSFHLQESILLGGRRVQLTVPQSGYGVTRDVLNTHGQSGQVVQLFNDWKILAPVFHQNDVAYISSLMERTPGSSHYQGEDVLILGKNAANQYVFTPRHVMGRSSGTDAPWTIWQEKGAVARKQSINTGDTLTLTNPKAVQELDFIIRVSASATSSLTNPAIQIDGGSLVVTGSIAPGEYLEYQGGPTAQRYDKNWKLVSNLPAAATSFNAVSGNNSITVNHSAGTSVALEVQFIVEGPVYVLETNNNL